MIQLLACQILAVFKQVSLPLFINLRCPFGSVKSFSGQPDQKITKGRGVENAGVVNSSERRMPHQYPILSSSERLASSSMALLLAASRCCLYAIRSEKSTRR